MMMRCALFVSMALCFVLGKSLEPSCDIHSLRCDIICSFQDLQDYCQTCGGVRRPMRFGKRNYFFKNKQLVPSKKNRPFLSRLLDKRQKENVPSIMWDNSLDGNRCLEKKDNNELCIYITDPGDYDGEAPKHYAVRQKQRRQRVSLLASDKLNTAQIVSVIKDVLNVQGLPIDPLHYGCRSSLFVD